MNNRSRAIVLMIVAAALTGTAAGQGAKTSASVVKIDAKADAPTADGKQTVILNFTIDKTWHLYANPTPQDFPGIPVTVTVDKLKPQDVKVDYPDGKVVKDATFGDHKVYEDKVTIKAVVQRARGDTSPLDLSIRVQACTDKQCLLPATVKLTVPTAK
jgi:thiol:disulfide interchange protein